MGQVIQKFENNQFLQVIQSYKETQATKAIHLLQDTQKDEVIYGIQDTQTSKVIHKIIKPMTAEQYLFLNSVCLTLQCERKNKETVFDGNIPSQH